LSRPFYPTRTMLTGYVGAFALDAGHVICRKRPGSALRDKRRQSPNASDVPGLPLIVDRRIVGRVYLRAFDDCPMWYDGRR
jgi:hypothetical protein